MYRDRFFLSFVLLPLFVGCGSTQNSDSQGETTKDVYNVHQELNSSYDESNITQLQRLNRLREASGMTPLSENTLLVTAAQNHAIYLNSNNISGHYEEDGLIHFTGVNPVDRTVHIGYKSRKISENVSTGQESEELSLDGLMGAIYHRFGFLAFDIDEIGYARDNKAYVYNMGNSKLVTLCSGESFEGSGRYYKDVCLDADFKIQYDSYRDAIESIEQKNPPYVFYPYKEQQEVTPAFFEESPDPLPEYGVSGFPISIEFNSHDYNMSKFTLKEFTLKDDLNNTLPLISYSDGTTVLTKENDIHHELSEYQFVLFSQERLDYNRTYNVDFSYIYEGVTKHIAWQFTTKSLENLITLERSDDTLNVELNKEYHLYFKPQNSYDTIATYSTQCHYLSGGSVNVARSLYDGNTVTLEIQGSKIEYCDLFLNKEKRLKLQL